MLRAQFQKYSPAVWGKESSQSSQLHLNGSQGEKSWRIAETSCWLLWVIWKLTPKPSQAVKMPESAIWPRNSTNATNRGASSPAASQNIRGHTSSWARKHLGFAWRKTHFVFLSDRLSVELIVGNWVYHRRDSGTERTDEIKIISGKRSVSKVTGDTHRTAYTTYDLPLWLIKALSSWLEESVFTRPEEYSVLDFWWSYSFIHSFNQHILFSTQFVPDTILGGEKDKWIFRLFFNDTYILSKKREIINGTVLNIYKWHVLWWENNRIGSNQGGKASLENWYLGWSLEGKWELHK